jgi:hypothetical protein
MCYNIFVSERDESVLKRRYIMENTMITTKVKFDEFMTKFSRIADKLCKIGAHCDVRIIKSFVKEVPVYQNDDINHVHAQIPGSFARVECVEAVVDFDDYKVGDYRVGAIVEATTTENNAVYSVDNTVDFTNYRTATLRCDHCKRNHKRAKCVVLIDNNTNEHKMVGRACLKDFIGYNVEMFAKYFGEITEMTLENEEPYIEERYLASYKVVMDVENYLAKCINVINECGYCKMTKVEALNVKDNEITETDTETAKKVIEYFNNLNNDKLNEFEYNVKMYVTGEIPAYSSNGYLAYAYVLYKKMIDEEIKREHKNIANAKSEYFGNVGDKINITGIFEAAGHYDTQFGTVVIYKITDENDNIFIWKTTSYPNVESGSKVSVRATIKEHSEYNGTKQTVLTRCKITECVPA